MLDKLSATPQERNEILGQRDKPARAPAGPEATYEYCSRDGALRLRKLRFPGKDFRWQRLDTRGCHWGLDGAEPGLYRAAEIRQAIERGDTVYVAEGEKDVDHLVALGLAATCNAHGAGDGDAPKWKPADTHDLVGARRVVILEDNDHAGRQHADHVAQALRAAGVRDVRRVSFSDLPEHGDVSDWLVRRRAQGAGDAELRADLLRLAESAIPAEASSVSAKRESPWDAAQTASAYLDADERHVEFLEPPHLVRGALTFWYSPRGIGKTLARDALAVRLARRGLRVLLVDRDNPQREIRRRLKAWGAWGLDTLRVLDRDHAPKLTDVRAWAEYPVGAYDVLILDSWDAATEGVGEQDSAKPSRALASLLDVVHSAAGPAVLVLANTDKRGHSGRGCGVIEDRGDIVFEVRDATDLKPSGKKPWWLELPPADRGLWADRATRRKRRDSYRLAFVVSKFRLGPEPEPFVYELRCPDGLPWACADVTHELVASGEQAIVDAAATVERKRDEAAAALRVEVRQRAEAGAPMHVRDEVVPFLMEPERGLSRDDARRLIDERSGRDWRVAGGTHRGDPQTLLPLGPAYSGGESAGIVASREPRQQRLEQLSILAAQQPCGPPESTTAEPALDAVGADSLFRRPQSPNQRAWGLSEGVAARCAESWEPESAAHDPWRAESRGGHA